ncbi:MAG: pirin family protein [Thaumarchaeota archaeon]|nr:pirin family protein [Nitrososphaerota archaeon]
MIETIKANEHHKSEMDWLSTYYHFSFADYFDPKKMNYGPLRVFNDDTIQPSSGFDFHPHRDMEIITYVIDGKLEHHDNHGNQGVIGPGEIQVMTAGSGILHSEHNNSKEKPLHLLQMWVIPDKKGLEPSWQQKEYSKEQRLNKLLQVVAPLDSSTNGALTIHQNASFYVSSLTPGSEVVHEIQPERKVYVFVIDGQAQINGIPMQTRDVAKAEDERKLAIQSKKQTELILIDLPEKYAVKN